MCVPLFAIPLARQCLTLDQPGQGLPLPLLERIEIGAEVELPLDSSGDVVEELWAPEDDRPGQPAVLENELPIAACAVCADSNDPRLAGRGVDRTDREEIDAGHLQSRRLGGD